MELLAQSVAQSHQMVIGQGKGKWCGLDSYLGWYCTAWRTDGRTDRWTDQPTNGTINSYFYVLLGKSRATTSVWEEVIHPSVLLFAHPLSCPVGSPLGLDIWASGLAGWGSGLAGWASGLTGWTSGLADGAWGLAGWFSSLAGRYSDLEWMTLSTDWLAGPED